MTHDDFDIISGANIIIFFFFISLVLDLEASHFHTSIEFECVNLCPSWLQPQPSSASQMMLRAFHESPGFLSCPFHPRWIWPASFWEAKNPPPLSARASIECHLRTVATTWEGNSTIARLHQSLTKPLRLLSPMNLCSYSMEMETSIRA